MTSTDNHSIWLIRSRQLSSSIEYWLSITGYDSRNRSLISRIYLLYLIAFFSAWTLSLMFYMANFLVDVVSPFLQSQGVALAGFAAALGTYILFAWSLYSIYKATYRSPLVFSEDDAYLVCQTPVNRRSVILFWLLGEWPGNALPFWAGAITVGFALLELDVNTGMGLMSISNIAIAGIKPLCIILPLHLALFCLTWVIGVYRLQCYVEHKKAMMSLRVIAAILAFVLFIGSLYILISPPLFTALHTLLWYIKFPLSAAFEGGSWALGLAVSIGLMIFSLAALLKISKNTNLSRAAQETRSLQAQRLALRAGEFEHLQELQDRDRLGTGHRSSWIPARPGAWVMIWKDAVQSLRPLTITRLWSWIIILSISLAVFFAPDSTTRLVVAIYWTMLVAKLTSARFKDDLGHWWIVNSLPLSLRRIILYDVARPVVGVVAITWIALWIGNALRLNISPIFFWMVPFVVVGVTLSAIFDMLRQSNTSFLLAGRKPLFGPVGLVLGMLCVAIPAVINILIANNKLSLLASVLASFLVGIVLVVVLLRLSEVQFRRIE